MPRLTADLIGSCASFVNCVRDRELDLHGLQIPVIENLGATLDQYDTLNLTSNDLTRLDNFPTLRRLRTILAAKNRIRRVDSTLGDRLPALESLILSNNNLSSLADVKAIADAWGSPRKKEKGEASDLNNKSGPRCGTLRRLDLSGNSVTSHSHYRLYTIWIFGESLRILDWQKIKAVERADARALFEMSEEGMSIAVAVDAQTNARYGGRSAGASAADADALNIPMNGGDDRLSAGDIQKIRSAIASASTIEEVTRLEKMLRAGKVPSLAAGVAALP